MSCPLRIALALLLTAYSTAQTSPVVPSPQPDDGVTSSPSPAAAAAARIASAHPSSDLEQDVVIALGGMLAVDHVGPERYAATKERLEREAVAALQILLPRFEQAAVAGNLSDLLPAAFITRARRVDPAAADYAAAELLSIAQRTLDASAGEESARRARGSPARANGRGPPDGRDALTPGSIATPDAR